MMINRKGQIAIGLLVLMTLILTLVALMSFYNNSQDLKLKIADARFADKVYSDELNWKNNVRKQVELLVVERYSKADIQNNEFEDIEVEIENAVGKVRIPVDRNESDVKEAYIELDDEIVQIVMEDFPISGRLLLENKERVWVWGFIPAGSFDQIKSSVGVIYRPSMKTNLNLTKIGLHGFKQISDSLEFCKIFNTKQEIENCLSSRLLNFDIVASVIMDENGVISEKSVEMKSKRMFAIDGELKKIEFERTLE